MKYSKLKSWEDIFDISNFDIVLQLEGVGKKKHYVNLKMILNHTDKKIVFLPHSFSSGNCTEK